MHVHNIQEAEVCTSQDGLCLQLLTRKSEIDLLFFDIINIMNLMMKARNSLRVIVYQLKKKKRKPEMTS